METTEPASEASSEVDEPSSSESMTLEEKSSKTRVKVNLSSILLRLNDNGTLLSTLTLSTANIALLLRANSMRLAARIGSLSLLDEIVRERADLSFSKLLSIEGDELVDFALETFHPDDAQYPGYDNFVWLRSNTLKIVLVPEVIILI